MDTPHITAAQCATAEEPAIAPEAKKEMETGPLNSPTACIRRRNWPKLGPPAVMLAVSTALFAVLSAFPIEGSFPTPSGPVVQAWLNAGVRLAFPIVATGLIAFSLFVWRFSGRRLASVPCGAASSASVLQSLRPLAWLPAIAAMRHTSAWFGTAAAGLFLPLAAPAVLAVCTERLCRAAFENGQPSPPSRRSVLVVAILSAAFLAIVQAWQGEGRFLGGGDVCHYETQLVNLLEQGNLDLTDRVEGWMDRGGVPAAKRDYYVLHSHMRRNESGRIHSVHAFGWPLLAWPFAAVAGDLGETALGILLGSLALAGVFAASRRVGASFFASAVATASLGAAWFWAYTALSRLPEMLGCALCIWGFWAAIRAADGGGGRIPAAVSAACCGYLPFAHMRFFPIAFVLAAWAAAALYSSRRAAGMGRRRAAVPSILQLAAVMAAWIVLWRIHATMFRGVDSFSFSEIFLSHPRSMLGIFVDQRGIGPIFPLAWLLCLAPIPFLARNACGARAAAALALLLEGTTLVACCANKGALIGACVSARYFLQAIPPLLPLGALWLDRTDRAGRTWWFFLALIPALYLAMISPSCTGRGLVHSPFGLWEFDAFRTFWMPFRQMFSPLSAGQAALCLVLPAALVAFPFILRRPAGQGRTIAAAAILAVGIGAGLWADSFLPDIALDAADALGNAHHWNEFRPIGGSAGTSFFDSFADDGFPATIVSGRRSDAPPASGLRHINAKRFADNDWAGRGLRWGALRTLRTKFSRRSRLAIRVAGRVERGSAFIAVNISRTAFFPEGIPLGEGPFELVFFVPRKKGNTLVSAALGTPDSVLRVDAVDFAPWSNGLENGAGPLPAGARVFSALPRTPATAAAPRADQP